MPFPSYYLLECLNNISGKITFLYVGKTEDSVQNGSSRFPRLIMS